ncbi:hypothetical protein MBT84_46190 [Streptomyces sp. MBT84]|uniref:hypothetical protein n=1 Tax=Streptomyces sp. MBT84 TaxID=1488414 RepID=UPI001DB0B5E9|nr:hypothetical protein [Streptomyces sp. MBT84]MBW8707046.1 hypothetical protein [Streptomyces sp. MBT84]
MADSGRYASQIIRCFAGCPVCDLHLHSVARRHPEIAAAGIREVVVFYSPADEPARVLLFVVELEVPNWTLYRFWRQAACETHKSTRCLERCTDGAPVLTSTDAAAWTPCLS